MIRAPNKPAYPAVSLAASAALMDQRTSSRKRTLVGVVFLIGFLVGISVNMFQASSSSTTKSLLYPQKHRQTLLLRIQASRLAQENGLQEKTNELGNDPCSVPYWLHQLSSSRPQGDFLPLEDLTVEDISFLHITFSIQGSKDMIANDAKHDVLHSRDAETKQSVGCLRKTLPQMSYRNVWLGDFDSYVHALAAQHAWLAAPVQQDQQSSFPFKATFVLDTDVYANPQSDLSVQIMQRALKNVDLALAYSPNRRPPNVYGSIHLQSDGIQAGIMGQRHTLQTHLFHQCVSYILSSYNGTGVMRQQRAINQVLESSVAQFLRVRWLPPEFHCWSPKLEAWEDFIVSNGPGVQNDACYFVHSHNLIKNGALVKGGICDSDIGSPSETMG